MNLDKKRSSIKISNLKSQIRFGAALGLFGALTAFGSAAFAQRYIFGRLDVATGVAPQSVAAGDFNGDGKLDVAVVNQNDGTVSILLGKPDATFLPRVDVAVGPAPVHGVVADLNGDGKLDLAVVASGGDSVSILLGNGDGTFQPHVDYGTGRTPEWIAVGDFNGDGKLDLAVANSADNTVSVLLGNGDGTFQARADYGAGHEPFAVAIGDFNSDGKLDLAVANSNCSTSPCGPGSVSILLGKGDGTFQTEVEYATGTEPVSVVAGDLDGDGKADLALACAHDNTVSVLLGKGDGTFQAHQDYAAGTGPDAVIADDFNHDGKLDLAVSNQTSATISLLLGKGDGTLQPRVDAVAGAGPRGMAAADFSGDGALDLAVANTQSNTISILLGAGDGTLENLKQYPLLEGAAIALTTGDFNGDGKPDLAVANQNCNGHCGPGPVSVLLASGGGTFQTHVDYATGDGPMSVTSGDFNGDGIIDLVLSNYDANTVSILLGNGDGSFRTHVDYAVGTMPLAVTVGDFNRDGKLDLAVAVDDMFPKVAVLLGNGDGTFRPPVNYGAGRLPRSIVAGDFNGDGILDLAVANQNDNTVSILLGNADGTFRTRVDYPAGNGPFSVVTGDFDADGKLDLAVANKFDGSASVLLGNGDGTFKPHVDYSTGSTSALSVTTGDFNADGKLDLAVANGSSGSVSVLLGNGDGTFRSEVGFSAGGNTYPYSVAENDFTGAGGSDLAVATEVGASIVLNSPVAALFPTTLAFGSQAIGTTSAAATVKLSNPGSEPLSISGIVASSDYAVSHTCGSSLAVGAACTVSVTFAPGAGGTRTGTITFTDAAANSPQTVSLTGTGFFDGPVASLSPSALDFGGQPVGTTSAPLAVTLTNSGNTALGVAAVSASGDFAETTNCRSSLAAAASCTISVTFTPTAAGMRTGTLSVTDNASGSPQTVRLTGAGNVPIVSLSPSRLSFGNQTLGTTSAAQVVTLTNTGGAALRISAITATGDFTQTNNCGSAVASGAHCAINVTFTPAAAGTRTGTLSITDNASGSPQSVSLTGVGNTPAAVSLSPSSVSFGSQTVGTTSAAQAVALTNTGGAALSFTSVTANGDFAQTNNCGSTVAAGASCAINVTFTPAAAGSRSGTLSITDNATGSPQSVSLTGTGSTHGFSLSPTSLTFASQLVGTTSAPQVVALSNPGNLALDIASIAVSGDFAQASDCGSSVAAGATCAINVTASPSTAGTRSGILTVTDKAGTSHAVSLTDVGADFLLAASSTSASIAAGGSATYKVTLTPAGGFDQTVSLSCSGAPDKTTCSVSPASVTLAGSGASTASVSITTTEASVALPPRWTLPSSQDEWFWPLIPKLLLSLIALAVLSTLGCTFRAWRGRAVLGMRPGLQSALFSLLLLGALAMPACGGGGGSIGGGGSPSNPGTPAGTYTLTVSASSTSGSTTLTHDIKLTLKIN